jgi:aldehyde dehydrogenase (NAD+)
MLATSDLPGGVVNLLTGPRAELIPTFATHEHLRAISGVLNAEERQAIRLGAAESVKRVHLRKAEEPRSESRLQPETREKQSASPPEGGAPNREPIDWFADKMQGVEEIRALVEFKTTWHPVGA